jgi:hypothetical protein
LRAVYAQRLSGRQATAKQQGRCFSHEKGECVMKAGIFFTGSGPILILTSYEALTDVNLISKLSTKGIKKFIAFELPMESVKDKYGHHFAAIMGDLHQSDDLRVLDYDGHHIVSKFSFEELGKPIFHEA